MSAQVSAQERLEARVKAENLVKRLAKAIEADEPIFEVGPLIRGAGKAVNALAAWEEEITSVEKKGS